MHSHYNLALKDLCSKISGDTGLHSCGHLELARAPCQRGVKHNGKTSGLETLCTGVRDLDESGGPRHILSRCGGAQGNMMKRYIAHCPYGYMIHRQYVTAHCSSVGSVILAMVKAALIHCGHVQHSKHSLLICQSAHAFLHVVEPIA